MKSYAATFLAIAFLAAPVRGFEARAEATPLAQRRWVGPAIGAAGVLAANVTRLASHGQALAFGGGLGLGIAVTQKLQNSTGFWGKRIPGTRLRMANLPVGGAIAFGAAALTMKGHPELARMLIAAGAGMTIGAVGTGLASPLRK